ncbi:MAG: hypothetical protein QOD99_2149 [Chthoniobacter sp.]|jgi:hypothetical protein|nr:hypothetical protein [Chthoniobacter sp.]
MEILSRYDFFEPGDQTALICIDEPELQRAAVDALSAIDFKMHTGLFGEDISLKLKAHSYDVVVVSETFNDVMLESNAVLAEISRIHSSQRRQQYVVLIGPGMITNDEMQAFQYSVDLTFSVSDLASLGPVVRRGLVRHKEFYRIFFDCLRLAGG